MRRCKCTTAFLLLSVAALFASMTRATAFPYDLEDGWTYYAEAVRAQAWPGCAYRFLSYIADAKSDVVNLWEGAGVNQEFMLRSIKLEGGIAYLLHANNDRVLVASSDCGATAVRLLPSSSHANTTDALWIAKPASSQPGHYTLQSAVRRTCNDSSALSFHTACTTAGPDKVFLGSDDSASTWRVFAVRAPRSFAQPASTPCECADPFAWFADDANEFRLTCTGDWIPYFKTGALNVSTVWDDVGSALDPKVTPPEWAKSSSRWAPESRQRGSLNFMVVSVEQPSGPHKLGSVVSRSPGADPRSYTKYAPDYLPLTELPTGDIDAHLFDDPATGYTYLVWKTDDNARGMTYTRIWSQRVVLNETNEAIDLIGTKQLLLTSEGLWWAPSFVTDGTLVEGPELHYDGGFYYLFFAAGRYNGETYTEGVARSLNATGPFEKMMVPLLSTGLVGSDGGKKLQGPGHGAIVQTTNSNRTYIVVAAHTETSPLNRKAYIMELEYRGGWPVAVVPFP